MTGNKEKLDDFVQVKGGTATFGGGDGKITGKGTIRTSKLNFENVYYVEELQHFNLFSVSQICDKKNKVLFTDGECLVLTKEFQLPDESQVVLRIPRRHDLYTFNLPDIQPAQQINYLLAKASFEESTKWHRRMTHVNFKTINKLAKHGLVECLPLKLFTNEHNCVAYNKGKQHKASYKAISVVRTTSEPLKLLHMDLFGPTTIRSIDHKYYSLVVTDDFSNDHLGKYYGKANDGFLVGYAAHSKAYRVYNLSSKKVEETFNLRYLEDKPNVQGLCQEWYFDLDYLTDSLGYTHFKTNTPVGTQDTNMNVGTHEDDSESECDEQAILVPSFSVPASSVPASHVPTSSVPARSVPASNVPAGGVLAGSINYAGFGDPAASEYVPAVLTPDHAANSTLPLGLSLGSSEHSTRFPSPSDLGNHQSTVGIFSSSSYDDDFCSEVTNLASSVVVDPVATKRVNTIHPQS
nr:putative ribonuclease H-like domain-containing protein [Tanacetum cinerariifolium]